MNDCVNKKYRKLKNSPVFGLIVTPSRRTLLDILSGMLRRM